VTVKEPETSAIVIYNPVDVQPEYLENKIEKNEMGGACSADGGEERRIKGVGGVT
jgi:hypothetical protein